jgi:hypothetical protein
MAVTRLDPVAVANAVTVTEAIAVAEMTAVADMTGVPTAAVVAVGAESHHPHGGETDAAEEEEQQVGVHQGGESNALRRGGRTAAPVTPVC